MNVTYSRNFDGTSHSAINSFNNGQSERIYHHASQQRYLCYAIKYIGSGVPENRAERIQSTSDSVPESKWQS